MLIINIVIAGLWVVFIVYWMLSAIGAKRNLGGSWSWPREIGLRLVILVLIVLFLRLTRTNPTRASLLGLNMSVPLGILGAALCALGVGFAIWARRFLGRNWGLPMSQKENAELVTGGPYAYVRHPVYSGMLLAMLGSAIGQSHFWLLPLIGATVYFAYSARLEECRLLEEFPAQYAAYRQRTKMLVPFIW